VRVTVILLEVRIVECLTSLSVDGVEHILAFPPLRVSLDDRLHVLVRVGSDLLQRVLRAKIMGPEDRLVIVIEVGVDLGVDRLVPVLLDLL